MSRELFLAGGTGVIGRRVLPRLVAAGWNVTANVRDDIGARSVRDAGATPITVDLFDPNSVQRQLGGFTTVVNLATSIPTGLAAARPSAWRVNDRIRTEASRNLVSIVPAGGRYVGESIAMPYVSQGANWIDEDTERAYTRFTQSACHAESAIADVAERGVTATALRFSMFVAADSPHITQVVTAARRGWWVMPGSPDAYASFVDIDDAAAAVVAALDAPGGVYNISEAEPRPRAEHAAALAAVFGRAKLRPLPKLVQRAGGENLEILSKSQRVSPAKFIETTSWRPSARVVEAWTRLAGST